MFWNKKPHTQKQIRIVSVARTGARAAGGEARGGKSRGPWAWSVFEVHDSLRWHFKLFEILSVAFEVIRSPLRAFGVG